MPFGGRGLGGVERSGGSLKGGRVTNAFRREGVGRAAWSAHTDVLANVTNAFRREGVGRAGTGAKAPAHHPRHQCLSAGGGWAGLRTLQPTAATATSPMPFGGRGLGGRLIETEWRKLEVTNAFRREGVGREAWPQCMGAGREVTNAFRREGVGREAIIALVDKVGSEVTNAFRREGVGRGRVERSASMEWLVTNAFRREGVGRAKEIATS